MTNTTNPLLARVGLSEREFSTMAARLALKGWALTLVESDAGVAEFVATHEAVTHRFSKLSGVLAHMLDVEVQAERRATTERLVARQGWNVQR